MPLTADKEDSSSPPPPQRKCLFYFAQSSQFNPPITGRPKAKSKAGSKVNPKSSSTHLQKTDADSEKNASDADTPQDGRGNPNLSGITLPLPISLVEPQLLSHNTGFYVITAGIEVGITTVKYVYLFLLLSPPNRLFFHLFPEELLTRASSATAHRLRRSRPGGKRSRTTMSVQRWLSHHSLCAARSDPCAKSSAKEAESQGQTFGARISLPATLRPCFQHSKS